tara:strand:- start:476 stop:712 length:237 start_codon:yes stop_codon:yes gene_type:complete
MSWKVWTGKKQDEIRHLRGLVDEIMIICEDAKEYGTFPSDNNSWEDITSIKHLAEVILGSIENTQKDYDSARADEVIV